jgi:aldehyde:ferredoxin oxidoreductase
LGYALSPTGADHMHNLHDTVVEGEGPALDKLRAFSPDLHPVPATVLNKDKLQLYYHQTNHRHFLDCAVMCFFLPYTPEQMVDLMNAVTGWDMDLQEIQAVGERTVTLSRVFNLREGFTAEDDRLPKRFFEKFIQGEPRTAKPLNPVDFEWARTHYYRMMGWDAATGVPTTDTLGRLGIDWAGEHVRE